MKEWKLKAGDLKRKDFTGYSKADIAGTLGDINA
jgi:hypothetical protein